MELFFELLGLCFTMLMYTLEAIGKLVGSLLEACFGSGKRPHRHRRPGRRQPVVVIHTDRPVSHGHVSRTPGGGGTFSGVCYACRGTGTSPSTHTPCRRCNGTGVYRKSW